MTQRVEFTKKKFNPSRLFVMQFFKIFLYHNYILSYFCTKPQQKREKILYLLDFSLGLVNSAKSRIYFYI